MILDLQENPKYTVGEEYEVEKIMDERWQGSTSGVIQTESSTSSSGRATRIAKIHGSQGRILQMRLTSWRSGGRGNSGSIWSSKRKIVGRTIAIIPNAPLLISQPAIEGRLCGRERIGRKRRWKGRSCRCWTESWEIEWRFGKRLSIKPNRTKTKYSLFLYVNLLPKYALKIKYNNRNLLPSFQIQPKHNQNYQTTVLQ